MASSEEQMMRQLAWIHHHYQLFNFKGFGADGKRFITILENDQSLCDTTNKK